MLLLKRFKKVAAIVFSVVVLLAVTPSIPVRAASTYTVDISQGDIIIQRGLTASSYFVSSSAGLEIPVPASDTIVITGSSDMYNINIDGFTLDSLAGPFAPNIQFSSLTADVSGTVLGAPLLLPALVVQNGARPTITLSGTNTLSGNATMPTIQVTSTSELTIIGEAGASLTVNGNGSPSIGNAALNGVNGDDLGAIVIDSAAVNLNATTTPAIRGSNITSQLLGSVTGGSVPAVTIQNHSVVRMFSQSASAIAGGGYTSLSTLGSSNGGNVGTITVTDSDLVMSGGPGKNAIIGGVPFGGGTTGSTGSLVIVNSNVSVMDKTQNMTPLGSTSVSYNGNPASNRQLLFGVTDYITGAPLANVTVNPGSSPTLKTRSTDYVGTASIWTKTDASVSFSLSPYITQNNNYPLASTPSTILPVRLQQPLAFSAAAPFPTLQAGVPIFPPVQVGGAVGGAGGYTYTENGLPSGVSLSSSGVLFGTPTTDGAFIPEITVTDSSGQFISSGPLSLTVNPPAAIIPPSVPSALPGVAVNSTINPINFGVNGGVPPLIYSLDALSVQCGLSIDPATGVVSGTITNPPPASPLTIKVTATDALNQTKLIQTDLPVLSIQPITPAVTGTQLTPLGTLDLFRVLGATGSITIASVTPALPEGLTASVNGDIVQLSGTPPNAEVNDSYSFVLQDSSTPPIQITQPVLIQINAATIPTMTVTDNGFGNGSYVISLNGGTDNDISHYTYSYTGTLPPGMSLDPATGQLTGTATSSGSYTFGLIATLNGNPSPPVTTSAPVNINGAVDKGR